MSDIIEEAFEQHYVRTSDQPSSLEYLLVVDKESDYYWEREGEPVVDAIMNAAEIPEAAAHDIQKILEDRHADIESAKMGEETEFDSDSYYEEKGVDVSYWQEEWQNFERSLRTEARFFSQTASHLAPIFEGIEEMQTVDNLPLVVDAGPNTALSAFYRARVFQSDSKLEEALGRPDRHLGSPPSLHAAAGRMNARGISVFYGANSAEVALAEVRPPVGSQVAIARFEVIRPIRLLDLTAFDIVRTQGSIFDPAYAGQLERAIFLGILSRRMTRPVMPDDEIFEYIATQAVADFLATAPDVKVDGIIFPSAQVAGEVLNVVLFHKAAKVEIAEIPDGTTIDVSLGRRTDDGWERDYTVTEEIPKKADESPPPPPKSWPPNLADLIVPPPPEPTEREWDPRSPTLRVDLKSIEVHVVEAVQFNTTARLVHRHRWERSDAPF
jgi:hypothetical protein